VGKGIEIEQAKLNLPLIKLPTNQLTSQASLISDYLSVWEIANRWQNVDPNKSDPDNLPLEVQDSLRFLCGEVLRGLRLYDERVAWQPDENDRSDGPERWISTGAIPPAIGDCANKRKYDKVVLDSCKLNRVELFYNQTAGGHPFPDFWFHDSLWARIGLQFIDAPAEQRSNSSPAVSNRRDLIDKSICQAVAKTLWDIDPNLNIAQMARHTSIQKYGGGSNYKGKDTLRNWLREVAPAHKKNKPGRPKKKP
jgi:hypothetical protein